MKIILVAYVGIGHAKALKSISMSVIKRNIRNNEHALSWFILLMVINNDYHKRDGSYYATVFYLCTVWKSAPLTIYFRGIS